MTLTDAEPKIVEVSEQQVAVIRGVVPTDKLPDFFDRSFTILAEVLGAQGVAITGAAFARYHGPPGEVADLEVGFTTDRAVTPEEGVEPGSLPGGTVARLVHHGGYDQLGTSWGHLGTWLESQGHVPASDMWEVYETEPTPDMNPDDLRTELNWPIMQTREDTRPGHPEAELLVSTEAGAPTSWEQALGQLTVGGTWWLAVGTDGTVGTDDAGPAGGRPHVRPVLGTWVDGTLYFATAAATVKGRLLGAGRPVSLSTQAASLDVVLEGSARQVNDPAELKQVAASYRDSHGWQPHARDGALQDAEGAPTAGPPPYLVYAVSPTCAYGFPHGDDTTPTRWIWG